MFGSSVLETAIGMIFVYLFLSLICSGINEGIASLLNKRGKVLFDGIKNILNDPDFTGLAQQLYSHGLVDGISKEASNPIKPTRLPSYMPSKTFASVLLDIVGSKGLKDSWATILEMREKELTAASVRLPMNPTDDDVQKLADARSAVDEAKNNLGKAEEVARLHADATLAGAKVGGLKDVENRRAASVKLQEALARGRPLAAQLSDPLGNIQRAVEALPAGHTKESLLVLLEETKRASVSLNIQEQAEKLQANLEQWFNDAMDRVSGWYKRWTQAMLLAIALVLVFAANVDTFTLANRLTRDSALRASIVGATEQAFRNVADPIDYNQAQQGLLKSVEQLNLPLGWHGVDEGPFKSDPMPSDIRGWLLKIIGLLISVFAVSMGAPFWFDTLSKFVNLRGAGPPPGETNKSAPQPVKTTIQTSARGTYAGDRRELWPEMGAIT